MNNVLNSSTGIVFVADDSFNVKRSIICDTIQTIQVRIIMGLDF